MGLWTSFTDSLKGGVSYVETKLGSGPGSIGYDFSNSVKTDISNAATNAETAASDALKNAAKAALPPLAQAASWIKYVLIAAAVVIGGIVVLVYLPRPRRS